MKELLRSPFLTAVLGGLVVAGGFLALGVTGRRTTRTVVQEAPVFAQRTASTTSSLTAHAIFERVAPAVVFVKALVAAPAQSPFDLTPQAEDASSTGSGFLIDRAGTVLTDYHVVEGADRSTGVSVSLQDSITRRAKVLAEDPSHDLAVLKVDLRGVPAVAPVVLGESSTVRVGDPTLTVGNPFGLDRTLTSEIVSSLQRQIEGPGGFIVDNVIQVDAPINLANSGAPVLDAAGRVIGINSQIAPAADAHSTGTGIGIVVPIDTAKELLRSSRRGGARRAHALR